MRWLQRHSPRITELASPRVLRVALDALTLTLDGTAAAATAVRRKRAVFHNALQYAVEIEVLPVNNLGRLGWRTPAVADVVDRRVVVNPRRAEELLTAVTYASSVDRVGTCGCSSPACITPGRDRRKPATYASASADSPNRAGGRSR